MNARPRRIALFFACLLLGGFAVLRASLSLTAPDLSRLPSLKSGDLVFQTTLDLQSVAVSFASHSLFTHMGILQIAADGTPVVVEAVGPVKETPLAAWMNRGFERRLDIRRIKTLKPAAAQKALAWARLQYGKPYDFYFLPDHNAFYCSELVRDAFDDGAGIPLGRLQKVEELTRSAAMEEIIRQRWEAYPLCKGVKGMTEEKCRAIIMKQELITPASIAADAQVERIYSNYPFESW